ncbi:hypothetical protein [Sporolactobacillus putidus]|uniref:Uncharacterized protein n=1 Tax=Sporolactobacillus putidus TaxID=492735 RepID=A0A917S4J2_9BACL|nr:hypothetical protein [Sporolactobacillus putidus]GGL57175.1 hypothetical protein GCM10007968_21490 [Sporolactobacillus putidus]
MGYQVGELAVEFIKSRCNVYKRKGFEIVLSKEHKLDHHAFVDDKFVSLLGREWMNDEEKMEIAIKELKDLILHLKNLIGKTFSPSQLDSECKFFVGCQARIRPNNWQQVSEKQQITCSKKGFTKPASFRVHFDVLVEAGFEESVLIVTQIERV